MEWILMVTWVMAGQNISSYTTEFASADLCMRAKIELRAERERFADERMKLVGTKTHGGGTIVGPSPTPYLLAICAKRK